MAATSFRSECREVQKSAEVDLSVPLCFSRDDGFHLRILAGERCCLFKLRRKKNPALS